MSAPSALPFPTPGRPAPRGAQRPQLRLVPPPRRTRRWFAALVLVAALGVVGVVSANALAAEAAFEAAGLEAEVDGLSVRYDELTAEVARLEAPDRVRHVAVEQLGMVPAEDPSYLALDDAVSASSFEGTEPEEAAAAPHDPVKSALGAGR